MFIKEGLDNVKQKGCDGNKDNVINSDEIQASVIAYTTELYY